MIHINLIPSNMWKLNLRKILGPQQWVVLSNRIREQQHWTCQACGISMFELKAKKWFHTHEMWSFDETTVQVSLASLVCLCAHCHLATHIGFASINNNHPKAIAHLCKVNHWATSDVNYYLEACFEQWSRQSQLPWKFNMANLNQWLEPDEIELVKLFLLQHNLV